MRFFLQMSAEDLNSYFYNEIIDLVFILNYSAFFYVSLSERLQKLAFVPGAFDLIETLSILAVLSNRESSFAFSFTLGWLGLATLLKWTSAALVVSLVIRNSNAQK